MSQYRKHYRVTFDGRGFDVLTSARDWAAAESEQNAGNTSKPMDLVFQVLHAACLRLKVDGIPRSYGEFLDGLDDFDDQDAADAADVPDTVPIPATA